MDDIGALRHRFRVLAGGQGQGLVHTAIESDDIGRIGYRCLDKQATIGGPYTQLIGVDRLVRCRVIVFHDTGYGYDYVAADVSDRIATVRIRRKCRTVGLHHHLVGVITRFHLHGEGEAATLRNGSGTCGRDRRASTTGNVTV